MKEVREKEVGPVTILLFLPLGIAAIIGMFAMVYVLDQVANF